MLQLFYLTFATYVSMDLDMYIVHSCHLGHPDFAENSSVSLQFCLVGLAQLNEK